jgi:hypothetical protein
LQRTNKNGCCGPPQQPFSIDNYFLSVYLPSKYLLRKVMVEKNW